MRPKVDISRHTQDITQLEAENERLKAEIVRLRLAAIPGRRHSDESWSRRVESLRAALKGFMDMWGSQNAHSESKRAQKLRSDMWDKAHAALERKP